LAAGLVPERRLLSPLVSRDRRRNFPAEQAALEELGTGLVPERRLWFPLVSRDRRWNYRNAVFL